MEEENFKNKGEEVIFLTHFMRPVLLWDPNRTKLSQVNRTTDQYPLWGRQKMSQKKKKLAKQIQ